jgi:hypothetical protein
MAYKLEQVLKLTEAKKLWSVITVKDENGNFLNVTYSSDPFTNLKDHYTEIRCAVKGSTQPLKTLITWDLAFHTVDAFLINEKDSQTIGHVSDNSSDAVPVEDDKAV